MLRTKLVARVLTLLLGFLVLANAAGQSQEGPAANSVAIQVVKYKDLAAAVRGQRGKVVVVDIWADWCVPCKMAFPHLVDLHKRYADKGLVCMSISLDEAKDKANALAFLKGQNAAFPNFLLDEGASVWQERFDINGPPAIFVFNRDNRWVKFDHNDPNKVYTHEDVEKVVRQMLGLSP